MREESGEAKIIELKPGEKEGGIKVVENPHADEVFADAAIAFSLNSGVVKITLTSIRPLEWAGKKAHVVIGRLAMPLLSAQHLVLGLDDFLKKGGNDPKLLVAERSVPRKRAVN